MNETFALGLQTAVFGLSGVFAVLIIFYLMTKLMMTVFTEKDK